MEDGENMNGDKLKKPMPYVFSGNDELVFVETNAAEDSPTAMLAMTSLLFGAIVLCFHWLSVLDNGLWVMIITILISIVPIITGMFSSFGMFRPEHVPTRFGRHVAGFYGFLMGITACILSVVLYMLGQFVLWG